MDMKSKRNCWSANADCNDRTGYRSGHLGPGEIVPAVERVRRATETGTRIDI